MATVQSDLLSAYHIASSTFSSFSSNLKFQRTAAVPGKLRFPSFKLRAFSTGAAAVRVPDKQSICTADELHYVSVPNSDWRLALWRYHPSPQAPPRNHPMLLLSGVGTNAIGYDLAPECSFARYMSGQGYDTWILEVRGAGLSLQEPNLKEIEHSAKVKSEKMEAVSESKINGSLYVAVESTKDFNELAKSESGINGKESDFSIVEEEDFIGITTIWDESSLVSELTETFMRLSERLSGFLSEGQSRIMSAKLFDQISKLLVNSQLSERFNEVRGGLSNLLETGQTSVIGSQIRDLSQRLVEIIEDGQRSVSPPLFNLQDRFSSTIEDFQKQLDLIVKYDWDFDHHLLEDIPTAIDYIRAICKPKDGKLLAVGHSMGGILLYAKLSRYGFEGRDPRLAAIVTMASSLDYTSSNSALKLLLPLADPAQALNVPVVPLGALLSASYPLSSCPPYALSWLNNLISAEDMMHPEMLKKLVLNNFCTIPAKLIIQLTTAFREDGLRDRSNTFFYKDHIHKCNIPVLALAGDQDLICPPVAVEATAKLIPEHLVTYKCFGEPGGPHYAHYDLVGGRLVLFSFPFFYSLSWTLLSIQVFYLMLPLFTSPKICRQLNRCTHVSSNFLASMMQFDYPLINKFSSCLI
ncbi:uncharacterized protein LOC111808492 isoform X1 [Cucurbita pepo subsp. pepo]|uniref:uncharacterized protein LOC111808492 isoform X1 n=2 Tax=Cucurbita pepo subsp. pepo TaxID=3664 RepID=UPI000C9D9D5E|nr:uncharacterized protein LOC111808492 isoform X1 [Cucurbita pepo subsp. pepo]